MHRWAACPGSVRLCKDIPSVTSVYAEEGTYAHGLGANILMDATLGEDPRNTSEMLEAVWTYTDYVTELIKEKNIKSVLIEHKFDLSEIHKGLFGTADCVLYDHNTETLHVIDYKHGAGIAVEVDSNEQLQYYGLGALLSTKIPCKTVQLTIVQPRCPHPSGPIRHWMIDPFTLSEFAADLKAYALATEDPKAKLHSGEHCRFCPAAATCPELHSVAVTVAKNEFSPALSYDPLKLAETLERLPVLEAWVKSVREFAYGEAMHGRTPPGWKLVPKQGRRKWRNEEQAPAYLIQDFGLTNAQIFKETLESPAQIEKKIPKEKRAAFNELTVSESSGNTLAPESDKREAIRVGAKHEFSVLETGEDLLK